MEILNSIQQRLSAACGGQLQYIDRQWGQLDTAERPAVKFPCALVELLGVDYKQLGHRAQLAEGTVGIEVTALRLRPSSSQSHGAGGPMECYRLCEAVSSALHGFTCDGRSGRMVRVGLEMVRSTSAWETMRVVFRLAWQVDFPPQGLEQHTAGLELEARM